uniref:peptide-methionine (R)-S-oxide reductase n=1 Tax=Eucampia antarctica TaxID=49252 RepID=A0A7S2RBX3_9STRA|mmetsp:Transcript_20136/g.19378  ORF Transcript_20136/g.19378 Transcript_20136/m.19378 type:complete len:245 (+) Transcript_20136:46-780(+)
MTSLSKCTLVDRSSRATLVSLIQLLLIISTVGNCLGFVVTECKVALPTNKFSHRLRLDQLSLSPEENNNISNNDMIGDSASNDREEKSEGTSNGDEGNNVGTWNPLRLAVLKLGLTELKYTSPLNYEKGNGNYNCASCDSKLFDSAGKYDSGSGWPSFWKTAGEDRVALKKEWDGRIECTCKKCGGHLGHVFGDGPWRSDVPKEDLNLIPESDPTWPSRSKKIEYTRLPRFCMNGASLKFFPKE